VVGTEEHIVFGEVEILLDKQFTTEEFKGEVKFSDTSDRVGFLDYLLIEYLISEISNENS